MHVRILWASLRGERGYVHAPEGVREVISRAGFGSMLAAQRHLS